MKVQNLPSEWKIVKLEDVISLIQNGIWGENPINNEDCYPVIRSTDITHDGKIEYKNIAFRRIPRDKLEKYRLKEGDILIVASSGSPNLIGRVAIFIDPPDNLTYLFSNFIIRIRPKNVNPMFLYYYLNSKFYHNFLRSLQQTSTGLRNISKRDILKMKIILPNYGEQQKIVEILSTFDEAIQKTDEIIAKTERLKKGLMKELLTGRIRVEEKDGKTAFRRETEFKEDAEIGKVPKDWEVVRLGDILEVCQYGLSAPISEKGRYHIVRMDELVNGYVIPHITKYVNLDEENFKKFKLEKGDILFNRTNAPDLVGRVGIFLLEGDYVFASYLIRLRPKSELFDSHFLTFYLLFSEDRIKQLATRAVHQANINATNLKKLKVPQPAKKEQQKIAEILSTIDKKLELERKRKEKLERIKKGLMDLLLTGEIRITQLYNKNQQQIQETSFKYFNDK